MSITDIFFSLKDLPPEELRLVRDYIDQQLENPKPRGAFIFDLHKGVMQMSPDFDDPLPDEFWLGEDDLSV